MGVTLHKYLTSIGFKQTDPDTYQNGKYLIIWKEKSKLFSIGPIIRGKYNGWEHCNTVNSYQDASKILNLQDEKFKIID